MPRLDAIGGSSAGVIVDNRPMVASLFRGIPADRFGEIREMFLRIRDEFGVPLEVANDGDVTALAGAMSLDDNAVLGIALGSSEAAGYVNPEGAITGWLNELAFAPVDYNPGAAVDEWSGDAGVGAQYFSQQCVFRLAPAVGIALPADATNAEKLKHVQTALEAGHEGARKIWESIGVYLGYGIAHYADFYDLRHVLILGRVTSGRGGDIILDGAKAVLEAEFPELASRDQHPAARREEPAGRPVDRGGEPAGQKSGVRPMLHITNATIHTPDRVIPRGSVRHRRVPHRRGRCRWRRAGRKRRDGHQCGRDDPRSGVHRPAAQRRVRPRLHRRPGRHLARGRGAAPVRRHGVPAHHHHVAARAGRGGEAGRQGRAADGLPRRRAARPARRRAVSQPEEEGRPQSAVPASADAGGGGRLVAAPRASGW